MSETSELSDLLRGMNGETARAWRSAFDSITRQKLAFYQEASREADASVAALQREIAANRTDPNPNPDGLAEYVDQYYPHFAAAVTRKTRFRQFLRILADENRADKCLPQFVAALRDLQQLAEREELQQRVARLMVDFITQGACPGHLNALLIGPTGTGKTTVADILCRLLASCGILLTDRFRTCRRDHFVASDERTTLAKVDCLLAASMEGVLFVDGTQALADGHVRSFVAQTLAKNHARLCLVVGGTEQDVETLSLTGEPCFPPVLQFHLPPLGAASLQALFYRTLQEVGPDPQSLSAGAKSIVQEIVMRLPDSAADVELLARTVAARILLWSAVGTTPFAPMTRLELCRVVDAFMAKRKLAPKLAQPGPDPEFRASEP